MISKNHFGIGYLAGTGISLIVILVWWFALRPAPDVTTFVGTITGIILAVALVYLAYWLTHSALEAEHIWSVAYWGATGLAIPTIPIVTIVLLAPEDAITVEASVLVTVAAASAVIGALFGAVSELETEHLRTLDLNRRNVVLNRVLRHDILNDASVLLWCAEDLQDEFGPEVNSLAEPIREKTEEIIELSKTAERIESLDDAGEPRPIDICDLVKTQTRTARRTHPNVEIETDLHDEAWVLADELLRTVIDNLIENAIEHNDQRPIVRVSVTGSRTNDGYVELCVSDNGPGMPRDIANRVSQAGAASTDTSDATGLGLWLVKWFVETYDGELAVEANHPRGTVVRVRLPAASAPDSQPVPIESTI